MQIMFEVDLVYKDPPDASTPSPSETDLENAITRGLTRDGFTGIDVIVHRQ